MARPRGFDADAVLSLISETFRRKGFEATSIEDIERATGLRRASLYGAFGDKRALYLAALRRYEASQITALLGSLEREATGRKAIEKLLHSVAAQAASDRCGCLLANAASENGGRDGRVARCVADNRRRVEGALHAQVLRGRADGSIKGRGDARGQARFLFAAILGLRGLAQSGATRAELAGVAESALAALP